MAAVIHHVIDISPHKELHVGYERGRGVWAEIHDSRWPEAENPRTWTSAHTAESLQLTLMDYGITVPEDVLDLLRTAKNLDIFAEAASLPSSKNFTGERTVSERRRAA